MSSATARRPPGRGFHHVSLTVTDVEASVAWYQRLLELQRLLAPFPNYGGEETGYAIVLIDPDAGISIGLHHHEGNDGQPFDERRTGLDQIGMAVPDRADLDSWAARLDSLGVPLNGVNDTDHPIPCSALASATRTHPTRVLLPPELTGHDTAAPEPTDVTALMLGHAFCNPK